MEKKTKKAKVANPSKQAGKRGKIIGYVAAKDMTLDDMIAWMQGCAKDAKCEDKKIQREIRRNYGQLVEVLKWAKDHGCPVGVVCTKARGYTIPMKEVLRDVGA